MEGQQSAFSSRLGMLSLQKPPLVMREGVTRIKTADEVGVALPSTALRLMELGMTACDCCYPSTQVGRGGTHL